MRECQRLINDRNFSNGSKTRNEKKKTECYTVQVPGCQTTCVKNRKKAKQHEGKKWIKLLKAQIVVERRIEME